MFFEGAEKKVEILLKPHLGSLFEKPRSFWEEIVTASTAEILSEVRNSKLLAFLLSESSLFVFEDRITMITCGRTTLAAAAQKFIESIGADKIDCVIFQRKNEFRSYLQKTSFADDVQALTQLIDGESYCFGKIHEHHNLLFSSKTDFKASGDDCTFELLMYDVDSAILDILLDSKTCQQKTRDTLGLKSVFGSFQIDDYCFKPFGYSLNALDEDTYVTIHVTPQKEASYISFETNADAPRAHEMILHFLSTLRPRSFDLITFNNLQKLELDEGYIMRSKSDQKLASGYDVTFYHYFHRSGIDCPATIYKD